MCANNLWRLLFLATVVAVTTTMTGVVAVASKDGECSANEASCVAANDAEPAVEEALTECKDAEKECAYWASLGEVSVDWFIIAPYQLFHRFAQYTHNQCSSL